MTELDPLRLLQAALAKLGYAIPLDLLRAASREAEAQWHRNQLDHPVDVEADQVVIDVRERG